MKYILILMFALIGCAENSTDSTQSKAINLDFEAGKEYTINQLDLKDFKSNDLEVTTSNKDVNLSYLDNHFFKGNALVFTHSKDDDVFYIADDGAYYYIYSKGLFFSPVAKILTSPDDGTVQGGFTYSKVNDSWLVENKDFIITISEVGLVIDSKTNERQVSIFY